MAYRSVNCRHLLHSADVYKVKAWPIKNECRKTQLNVRSSNRRLGVAAERINYLCGSSWGESSRFEARPTEAVYTDRKVRGHASKHVVGAKLQGLRAGHQGREWLQIYNSFSAKSCSLYMYQWHGASMYKTYGNKYRRTTCMQQYLNYNRYNTPWLRPHGGPYIVFAWPLIDPQVKDLIILSAVPTFHPAQSIYI